MPAKIDRTLAKLTPSELKMFRDVLLDAMYAQPPHTSPAYNPLLAYELSVLNWDVCSDLAGNPHLFDEWWLTQNTDIA